MIRLHQINIARLHLPIGPGDGLAEGGHVEGNQQPKSERLKFSSAHHRGVVSTRAISILKRKEIPYEVVKYEHQVKGAEFAARATGYPLGHTVKTLVVQVDRKGYCLALLPGHMELNLKKLATLIGGKRSAMVDTKTAERLTGYLVGGISPFGTKQRLQTIMESSILELEEALINAGQRGVMLKMSPADIVRGLDCRVASIARK